MTAIFFVLLPGLAFVYSSSMDRPRRGGARHNYVAVNASGFTADQRREITSVGGAASAVVVASVLPAPPPVAAASLTTTTASSSAASASVLPAPPPVAAASSTTTIASSSAASDEVVVPAALPKGVQVPGSCAYATTRSKNPMVVAEAVMTTPPLKKPRREKKKTKLSVKQHHYMRPIEDDMPSQCSAVNHSGVNAKFACAPGCGADAVFDRTYITTVRTDLQQIAEEQRTSGVDAYCKQLIKYEAHTIPARAFRRDPTVDPPSKCCYCRTLILDERHPSEDHTYRACKQKDKCQIAMQHRLKAQAQFFLPARCAGGAPLQVHPVTWMKVLRIGWWKADRYKREVKESCAAASIAADKRGANGGLNKMTLATTDALDKTMAKFPRTASHYASASSDSGARYYEAHLSLTTFYLSFLHDNEPLVWEQSKRMNYFHGVHRAEHKPTDEAYADDAQGSWLKPATSYSTARQYFSRFDIKFGTPRTDKCEKCDEFQHKLTTCPTTPAGIVEYNLIMERYTKHLRSSDTGYASRHADFASGIGNPKRCVFVADAGSNLRSPLQYYQDAYYLRILPVLNYIIVCADWEEGGSIRIYYFIWDESWATKGSDECISCINYFLKHFVPDEVEVVIGYADNCAGQLHNNTYLTYAAEVTDPNSELLPNKNIKRFVELFQETGHT